MLRGVLRGMLKKLRSEQCWRPNRPYHQNPTREAIQAMIDAGFSQTVGPAYRNTIADKSGALKSWADREWVLERVHQTVGPFVRENLKRIAG
jgi:hypothetical protein